MSVVAGSASRWPARLGLRPQARVETVALAASMFFASFANGAFWRAAAAAGAFDGARGLWVGACVYVAIVAVTFVLLAGLLNRWTLKPLLTALLLVTAAATHFMGQYGVYLDPGMIRNVLQSDGRESGELLSLGLLPPLLLFGVLPSLLLWRVRVIEQAWSRALWSRLAAMAAALVLAMLALLGAFQDISALMRNHKEMRHLVTPANYLVSLARVAFDDSASKVRGRAPIGTDARVAARPAGSKPRLLLIVVGETARAQNWGLNGYARQTTPELARIGPVNFPDVTACGSSTEVSVPCMFSPYGRRNYDKRRIQGSESLLNVLEYAGIPTLWRDNQTGCKNVCKGLAFESFEHDADPDYCNAQGCSDLVMLRGLRERLAAQTGDAVVVLHQLGNHGPSYYRRYPPRLRRFAPTCDTNELGRCSREQIVNAYDNALLATDEFLARSIRALAEDGSRDTALIYVSDHGESLGENGLYLHGLPYAIAPRTQTRVPMTMWFSPGFAASRGLDLQCLRREALRPASHDNLFHSVLGLMQVRTSVYARELDLFAPCAPA
ncbi:phosphoethanolamine transferase [Lysobacter sp. BMK333-48F3]|uniref:phosphoethanolamine transferase n=1 Tax=Lysobacter sp. BMK333-48F3 TaxID=2867962 RepID=UPI001C8BD7FF|nr:phosphoethanolamine--lipid A transferase [Lysobacter sp. BMK333-48F3]MBX9400700.1 phosphoethanolamine transferase [Lysobacter sp. BMK333-48F3]